MKKHVHLLARRGLLHTGTIMRRLLNRLRAVVQWEIPSADKTAHFFNNACLEAVYGAIFSVIFVAEAGHPGEVLQP